MSTFKDLKVWQVNQDCIRETLKLLKRLPDEYAFQHIGKQLFRAISSVGANLAEGQDSHEGKEFIRYISIAVRSAIESDHWLATLQNLGVSSGELEQLAATNHETIKMLKGLRKSIEEKRSLLTRHSSLDTINCSSCPHRLEA